MRELDLCEVYRLLEPGPVALLTTARKGRANVMAMSWHMMVEFTPPLIACVVSSRNASFGALRATRECVIAIPPLSLAAKVVEVGNCSGRNVDKFKSIGLTAKAARQVSAPLVGECFANLECRVLDTRLVNAFNLFILECVQAWKDPRRAKAKTIHHRGWGEFAADGKLFRLASRKP